MKISTKNTFIHEALFSRLGLLFIKSVFVLFFVSSNIYGQNQVSVPFGNGFVGTNGGNAVSNNSYYLTGASGLGWSNIQFAQTTNANVFVAQGNDIIGMVKITDFNGVQHTINGFIKWRTPSGNNPHTMVFQPSSGTFVLATNGLYGINNYTIDATKYIGLTRLGQVLTISPLPGTVSGNASTSGLLDALNDFYTALPRLSISGTTVLESEGIANVSVNLDAVSSSVVTLNFYTQNASATSPSDYTAKDTLITFNPGQTSKSINIPITVDAISEPSENFKINIRNATNASISKSFDSVVILESALPVEFLEMHYECTGHGGDLNWSTASEHNASFYKVEISEDGDQWETISVVLAKGTTNEESLYKTAIRTKCPTNTYYLRLLQGDQNGSVKKLGDLAIKGCEYEDYFQVFPNPTNGKLSVSMRFDEDSEILFNFIDDSGKSMYTETRSAKEGYQTFHFDLKDLVQGNFQLFVSSDEFVYRKRILLIR